MPRKVRRPAAKNCTTNSSDRRLFGNDFHEFDGIGLEHDLPAPIFRPGLIVEVFFQSGTPGDEFPFPDGRFGGSPEAAPFRERIAEDPVDPPPLHLEFSGQRPDREPERFGDIFALAPEVGFMVVERRGDPSVAASRGDDAGSLGAAVRLHGQPFRSQPCGHDAACSSRWR